MKGALMFTHYEDRQYDYAMALGLLACGSSAGMKAC
jgi:hypothetical protein